MSDKCFHLNFGEIKVASPGKIVAVCKCGHQSEPFSCSHIVLGSKQLKNGWYRMTCKCGFETEPIKCEHDHLEIFPDELCMIVTHCTRCEVELGRSYCDHPEEHRITRSFGFMGDTELFYCGQCQTIVREVEKEKTKENSMIMSCLQDLLKEQLTPGNGYKFKDIENMVKKYLPTITKKQIKSCLFNECKDFIIRDFNTSSTLWLVLEPYVSEKERMVDLLDTKNPVSKLNEYAMQQSLSMPKYTFNSFGNNTIFECICVFATYKTTGKGNTKKEAKRNSALEQVKYINKEWIDSNIKVPFLSNMKG